MSASRRLVLGLAAAVLLLGVLQLVPYGRAHTNPPDGRRVAFDAPGTEQLVRRACYDCHSNRTRWPWYASVAPMSWRVQSHVDEGRARLNFTAFDPASEDVADAAGEAAETVSKGEMPPADYLLAHPEARLTASEKEALAAGLSRTFAGFGEGAGRGEGADRSAPREKSSRQAARDGGRDRDRD
jgi:hypothetical protein